MNVHVVLVKIHRVAAALFLLAIVPAAYFSMTASAGAEPHPLVYGPLLPMAILTLTGTYQLVRPWVGRRRAANP